MTSPSSGKTALPGNSGSVGVASDRLWQTREAWSVSGEFDPREVDWGALRELAEAARPDDGRDGRYSES